LWCLVVSLRFELPWWGRPDNGNSPSQQAENPRFNHFHLAWP
jgi:hypothetical protein